MDDKTAESLRKEKRGNRWTTYKELKRISIHRLTHPKADPADDDHQATGKEVAPDVERDLILTNILRISKRQTKQIVSVKNRGIRIKKETFLSKTMSKPELVLSSFWAQGVLFLKIIEN